ncbi:MAG TPA: alpha/beta fold hydrolase [Actinomycetota bacterium]|nr:alpha/beta fold hydrolase [Actinomycetota bacterium]
MGDDPRRRRWPLRLLLTVLVLTIVFYGGGGWYFSERIHERALSGEARRDATAFQPTTDIVAVADDATSAPTVTLAVTDEAPSVDVDGVWGLRWDDGYGQVGGILERNDDTVTRAFLLLDGDMPTEGDDAQLDFRGWDAPPTDVEEVTVRGELGAFPAWFVPGEPGATTWAILVHGNEMTRLDGARVLPAFQEAGVPSLSITYRNDAGAPEDPSGLLRYGLTEWKDLEAAVLHARREGAERVVLYGVSMGGGIVMSFLQRSGVTDAVAGVVLDAPMLDLSATVDDNATRERLPVVDVPLPSSLTAVAKWIADQRFDVRWDELDYLEDTDAYGEIPFLVFHGVDDTTIPVATSRRFARLLPDTVTLVTCAEAGHVECWNVDGEGYALTLRTFVGSAAR